MKKILFINFRRIGDIFFSTHLAQKLKAEHPHSSINYLVYKESAAAFNALTNIDNVYLIDRKNIITYIKSPIFPAHHAINLFSENIKMITEMKWDIIVNFSNDSAGTHIASALKLFNPNAQVLGTFRDEKKTLTHSSAASQYLNEYIGSKEHAPIHLSDCYLNFIEGTLDTIRPNEFVKINTKTNQNHFKKLNDLRTNEIKKLIGIQLKSSSESKDIPMEVVANVTKKIIDLRIGLPIFLISHAPEEINYAKDLSNFIGTTITTLSTTFEDISSVLLNLDLLVTPDTSIKHLADLLEVPMIEFLNSTSQLKQSSISANNSILVNDTKNNLETTTDLIFLIQKMLNPEIIKTATFANSVLNISFSEVGVFYSQDVSCVAGSSECEKRFINKAIFNRVLLKNKMELRRPLKTQKHSTQLFNQELTKLKLETVTLSKLILSGLRSLLSGKSDKTNSREFLLTLTELLTLSLVEGFLRPLVLNLKGKIESISDNNSEENRKRLEAFFFEMKGQVSETNLLIKELESFKQAAPKNRFMEL